ncbi:hypothetical protein BJX70DRAFT_398061 [Aspergillus crustosus]
MPSSMYSLGFFAALAGLTKALPTPATPTVEDLTSTGTTSLPEVPEIPTSVRPLCILPSGANLPELESSFMGLGFSNDLDLGNAKELPTSSTDFVLGSAQELDSDSDSDDDEEENGNYSDSDSGFDLPDLDSSFMGLGFSNDLDLGNAEELPKSSTDFLLGSVQTADDDDDEEEGDDDKAAN